MFNRTFYILLYLYICIIPSIYTQDENIISINSDSKIDTTVHTSSSTSSLSSSISSSSTIEHSITTETTSSTSSIENNNNNNNNNQNTVTILPTKTPRSRPLLVDDHVDPQMEYYHLNSKSSPDITTTYDTTDKEETQNLLSQLFSDDISNNPNDNNNEEEEEEDLNSVEWITAEELKRRISIENERKQNILTKEQSQQQLFLAKNKLLQEIKQKLYNPSLDNNNIGLSSSNINQPRTLQADGTPTPTPGPLYPINPEDLEVEVDSFGIPVTFQVPIPNRTTDDRPIVPLVPESTCRTDEIVRCPSLLSSCLGNDAENRELACECFRTNGKCYRDSGCFEMIPKTTINFCYYRFFCEMDQCEGAGAFSLHQFAFSFIVWSMVIGAIAYLVDNP